jgi:ABC-type uncharacterized transport system auxiliary subunit
MAKLTPFALAAVATLCACSMTPPQTNRPTPITNAQPYAPGSGVVVKVFPTPAAPGAAAVQPTQRLEIKMDNGKVQYVDTTSNEFAKGTRVTLTEDRVISRM